MRLCSGVLEHVIYTIEINYNLNEEKIDIRGLFIVCGCDIYLVVESSFRLHFIKFNFISIII